MLSNLLSNRSTLTDVSLKSALCLSFALAASSGSSASTVTTDNAMTDSLNHDEAYLLVNVNKFGVKGPSKARLTLSDKSSKLKLSIVRANDMQLVKVKAGIYKPTAGYGSTAKGIVVEPGTVTYIGDWKVQKGQRFMVNGVSHNTSRTGYRVNFNVEQLMGFAEENPWVKQYPLHVAHVNGKRVVNNWTPVASQLASR